jgi:transposase
MPRTHGEDQQFRSQLRESPEGVRWQSLYDVTDEQGEVVDRLSVCANERLSSGGYRLLWYRSTRKTALDRAARTRRLQRACAALTQLQERLAGPRTRFRERGKVQQAVDEILTQYIAAALIRVQLEEQQETKYRQAQPGRPSKDTKYKKETRPRYHITWDFDAAALAEEERDDGIFPLLTNDHDLTAQQVLQAYKRQPLIEKRFSQFKTDFAVAPVYLKNVARIQGLLTVYFFVLLVQTLLERELREAIAREQIESLPLYPEGRPCKRPTTRRILDLFEPIQRHVLTLPDDATQTLVTQLTPLQSQIAELLGLSPEVYGR